MEHCRIDEIIGDRRAIMVEDGAIESFAVYEQEKPISILRLMPYAIAVKRTHERIICDNLEFAWSNLAKENASCVFSMMTRPDKHHLGLSDEVMNEALMQQKKQARAFTYHNPENMQEMIQYEQFGFAPVSDNMLFIRKQELLSNTCFEKVLTEGMTQIEGTDYTLRLFEQDMMYELLKFVNRELGLKYGIFAIRSIVYYEKLLEELEEYKGHIFVVYKEDKIVGYFAMEGVMETDLCREAMFEQEDVKNLFFEEKKEGLPVLARIVSLKNVLKYVCSDGNVTIALRIEDPMLRENNGMYLWYLDERGSRVELIENYAANKNQTLPGPELSVTIGEFTSILFGYKKTKNRKFDSIRLLGPVWLPERD